MKLPAFKFALHLQCYKQWRLKCVGTYTKGSPWNLKIVSWVQVIDIYPYLNMYIWEAHVIFVKLV